MSRERIDPNKVQTYGDWYKRNKYDLNRRRKAKYKNDKEYREALKVRTGQRYKDEHGILEDGKRIVESRGTRFVAYKLSDAAVILDVNVHTLRGVRQL